MTQKKQLIIFTDLDGTLLDHDTYSFKDAKPALELIRQKQIPLVFCTSKTCAETEYYRNMMHNEHPFIVENGGGVYIPRDYFPSQIPNVISYDAYNVVSVGLSYQLIRDKLKQAEAYIGCQLVGFGDMTTEELARDSGLNLEQAKLAKQREYSEPFTFTGTRQQFNQLKDFVHAEGLAVSQGGRYYALHGKHDKGMAVKMLLKLLHDKYGRIHAIGLGDSIGDLSMFQEVDEGYLLPKQDGSYAQMDLDNLIKVDKTGPAGWRETILACFHHI